MDKESDHKYMLMCEALVEIQSIWRGSFNFGDLFTWKTGEGFSQPKPVTIKGEVDMLHQEPLAICVWLPRVDDIIKMFPDKFSNRQPHVLIHKFNLWIDKKLKEGNMLAIEFISYNMVQIWLMFYMEQEHKKGWNIKQERWIVIEE